MMRGIIGSGLPRPGVPWSSVPMNRAQTQGLMSSGNPSFLFNQPSRPAPPPAAAQEPVVAAPFRVEQPYYSEQPINAQQATRLLQGESPSNVLAKPVPMPIPTPVSTPVTPGYVEKRMEPSGLRREGQYMYGGPSVSNFPWRTGATVTPSVGMDTVKTDIKSQFTPEMVQLLEAGEDPATILNQTPSPEAPMSRINISGEQRTRLMAGEDPMNVLPSNILPEPTPGTPLPPGQTPESVGQVTETPPDQLSNPPWTSMELSKEEIPDYMQHVITDPNAMNLLQNLIPNASWDSDIMRVGTPSRPSPLPSTIPEPAPVPMYSDEYLYGGGTPVPGFSWSS